MTNCKTGGGRSREHSGHDVRRWHTCRFSSIWRLRVGLSAGANKTFCILQVVCCLLCLLGDCPPVACYAGAGFLAACFFMVVACLFVSMLGALLPACGQPCILLPMFRRPPKTKTFFTQCLVRQPLMINAHLAPSPLFSLTSLPSNESVLRHIVHGPPAFPPAPPASASP